MVNESNLLHDVSALSWGAMKEVSIFPWLRSFLAWAVKTLLAVGRQEQGGVRPVYMRLALSCESHGIGPRRPDRWSARAYSRYPLIMTMMPATTARRESESRQSNIDSNHILRGSQAALKFLVQNAQEEKSKFCLLY
jgi:hypothetical protein